MKKKYTIYSDEEPVYKNEETLEPYKQKLVVRYEVKGRGGKKATLVAGFVGSATDLKELAKKLKSHCGAGGNVVSNEILVQGDHVKKVAQYLRDNGYKTNKV